MKPDIFLQNLISVSNDHPTGMNRLMQCVQTASYLEYVDLSGNHSTPWEVYCVIIRNCCAGSLTVCGDLEMEKYVENIAGSLEANKGLGFLTLCGIGRRGVDSIDKVLITNTTLSQVNLSWKKQRIGKSKDNILLFTQYLDKSEVMVSNNKKSLDINIFINYDYIESIPIIINLCNRSIDDDAAALIAFGLHNNKRVHRLDVSRNQISDDGMVAIVNSLSTNNTIKELDLSLNRLSSSGMNLLLKPFEFAASLKYIDLSGNFSSPWDAYCVVIKNCHVDSLVLCGDDGMKDYIEDLTDNLEANTGLKSLTLCDIGIIGLQSIKAVLVRNTTLNDLGLSWKNVSSKDTKIEKNILLHTMLPQNTLDDRVHVTNYNKRIIGINILHSAYCGPPPNKIDLSFEAVSDDIIALVAFGLQSNDTLHELDISSKCLSVNGVTTYYL